MSLRNRAQVALVALGLAAVLFLFVFPTRAFFSQRREVNAAQNDVNTLHAANQTLEEVAQRLQSRPEIERQAREHFHMHYPGEEVFTVLPAPSGSATTTTVP
ncbi:MAG TPA: septum formation initiator family protein [Acidimicrobiia bacterium]|nr:septum formation initiator family protein [Acidimicrobiia bacterium]